MKLGSKLVLLGLSLSIAGCSPWTHVTRTDGRQVDLESYSLHVPAGWSYATRPSRDFAMISRDGPKIQLVQTRWIEYDRAIFPGDTQRDRLERDMLPTDVAQLVIAARQRELGLDSLETVALDPATVAGHDGFRVEYNYRTTRGVGYRGVAYGSVRDPGVFMITFEAPDLHFYERDFPTFEAIVASARGRAAQ